MITEAEIVKIINLGIDCEHTTNEIARQILFEIAQSAPKATESPSPIGAVAEDKVYGNDCPNGSCS